jgi:DNA mismatch endonuclease (patch repair protein)
LADIVDPATRSRMMAGIKGKDTKPEMAIRRMLHAAGFRFRLHDMRFPGRPDLVLPKYRAVVFVHGCFWHGHQNCLMFRLPKSRADFWEKKISQNKSRDERYVTQLLGIGWRVLIIWECATKGASRKSPENLLREIEAFLNDQSRMFESLRAN